MYEIYQLLVQLDAKTKQDIRVEIYADGGGCLIDAGWDGARYVLREWDSFAEGIEEMKKELMQNGI